MRTKRFFHLRFSNAKEGIVSKGGYTFCAIVDPEIGRISWGVAKCNKKDQYNKKIGRIKSEGRAKSRIFSFETCMMEPKEAQIFVEKVAKHMDVNKTSVLLQATIDVWANEVKEDA